MHIPFGLPICGFVVAGSSAAVAIYLRKPVYYGLDLPLVREGVRKIWGKACDSKFWENSSNYKNTDQKEKFDRVFRELCSFLPKLREVSPKEE